MDNVRWLVRKGGHSGRSNCGIHFYLKRLQGLENGKVTLQCNVITEFNQRFLSFRNLKVEQHADNIKINRKQKCSSDKIGYPSLWPRFKV